MAFATDIAAYLAETGESQRAFAQRIGTTDANMSRIATGKARPSAELAEKIEAATGGKITFKSLMLGERAA